jgi:hypothetical protein
VYVGEKDYEHSVASTRTNTNTSTQTNPNGTEVAANNASGQTPMMANQSWSRHAELDPVQTARSRGLIGFDHEERSEKGNEASKRARRQLLY